MVRVITTYRSERENIGHNNNISGVRNNNLSSFFDTFKNDTHTCAYVYTGIPKKIR